MDAMERVRLADAIRALPLLHNDARAVAMQNLFAEIRAAIVGGTWVIALMSVLAVPDICAALGSENGRSTGGKYKAWIRNNLGWIYPSIDPGEFWQIRCSMLHQGLSAPTRSGEEGRYSRVVFTDSRSGYNLHDNVFHDAINLDFPSFAEDVIHAADWWLEANATNPHIRKNLIRLVRWYPDGFAPYISGLPVLT